MAEAARTVKATSLAKGRLAAGKFFWKNLVSAFKWVRRDPKQPQLG